MYCKYCGKQIEEDSLYCKHCGGRLNEVKEVQETSIPKMKLLEHFKSYPLKVQILIITYIIYLLIWICCIINAYDIEYAYQIQTVFINFIIFGFILPFAMVCGYYFRKRYKENKSASIKEDISRSKDSKDADVYLESNTDPVIPLHNEEDKIKNPSKRLKGIEPLLPFAKSHGKMQLVKKTNSETNTTEHYCLFEDSEGNIVNVFFANELGTLSAEDISKNKYKLCVKEYNDGSFELDYIEDKNNNDNEILF